MNNLKILQKLELEFTEPVRDPLWKHIYLSKGFKKLASTPPFIKLGSIKQLGPTWLVYPGATHTRLSHSFGVFEVAKRMIKALAHHPECPKLSIEGVYSFLAACLLHDTGHFPYAHSLKELPLREHEEITANLILTTPINQIIENEIGGIAEWTAAIVDKNRKITESKEEVLFYRNILSGVMDPDKMDYLNRDAFFCGVPYGLQDIDYVINRIIPDKENGIAVDSRGIEAIENILFSKYLMYKSVYWHKTVRIATAMIKKALLLGLKDEIISLDSLYFLDDYQFSNQFSSKNFKYGNLIEKTDNRKLHHLSAEITWNKENPIHSKLIQLDKRLEYEAELANLWGIDKTDIIIDITEPINFETNFRIEENGNLISATEYKTIFNDETIKKFENSLRKIRILTSEKQHERFNPMDLKLLLSD